MMNSGIFSVSEFARLSRTTRDILHHYDKIGLLSPVSRGENNYRYYSSEQLAFANMIRLGLELGMTLAEIKRLNDKRNPERMDKTLSQYMKQINAKIEDLIAARDLTSMLQKSIHLVLDIDEGEITTQFMPEEAITRGDTSDYSKDGNPYDALRTFYRDMGERHPGMNLNYPVWGLFSKERIERGDWTFPDRYYFYNPQGVDRRPAARYAVGYARGGYGQTDELYTRVVAYINQNGLEICGDAYEEYPLNEVCISSDANYLIRVMIPVREKTA